MIKIFSRFLQLLEYFIVIEQHTHVIYQRDFWLKNNKESESFLHNWLDVLIVI